MARRLNIDGDGQDDLMRRGGEHWAVFVYQIVLLRLLAAPARVAANSAMDSSERISRSKGCPTTRCASGIAINWAGRSSKRRIIDGSVIVGIHINDPQTAALLVAHCRPSFYFRLEEGEVEAGDEVVQVEAGPERLTVSAVNALLYMPGHPRSQLEPALRIPALSGGWRRSRAEPTANALVNRRFNKRRQMRWSPKGAQRVLQAIESQSWTDGYAYVGLKLTHDPLNCSTLSHVLFTKFGSAKSGGRQNGRHGIASLNLGNAGSPGA